MQLTNQRALEITESCKRYLWSTWFLPETRRNLFTLHDNSKGAPDQRALEALKFQMYLCAVDLPTFRFRIKCWRHLMLSNPFHHSSQNRFVALPPPSQSVMVHILHIFIQIEWISNTQKPFLHKQNNVIFQLLCILVAWKRSRWIVSIINERVHRMSCPMQDIICNVFR